MNPKPNIIFILADDMGYGDMSRFNGGLSQTPVLDDLAGEGLCLTQHYAGSPVCNPSRACLLTGRYAHRTGSIDTFDHLGSERLCRRERTLADVLHHAGYATGLVGKWHNGSIGQAYHPNARGFDEFVGFRGGWQFYNNARLERNGVRFQPPPEKYLTDLLTDEAVDYVTRHRKEPFFLHLAYNCPHFPIEAPAADVEPFANAGFTRGVRTLYGMIRNMDRNIGRLLETLNKLGLEENTVVVFTSDNGPDFGGSGDNSLVRFNCHFHGQKGLSYEGGIRLPLLARWPAGLPGGRTLDEMVHMTDWLPTILAMCGAELPPDHLPLDGWNVLPVLRGEGGKVNTRRFWQWNRYHPYIGSNAAMRDGDWKLVQPRAPQTYRDMIDGPLDLQHREHPELFPAILPSPTRAEMSYGPPPPAELYNLRDDPEEAHNLAGQDPARVTRMLADLGAWFAEVEADRRQCEDAVLK
jgi:arylsulfatase A-like enzyme